MPHAGTAQFGKPIGARGPCPSGSRFSPGKPLDRATFFGKVNEPDFGTADLRRARSEFGRCGLSGLLHSRRMRLQKDQNGVCACSIEDSAAQRISRFRSFIRVDLGGIQAALLLQPISTIERRTYRPSHSPGRVSDSSALRQYFMTFADTTTNQTRYVIRQSNPSF